MNFFEFFQVAAELNCAKSATFLIIAGASAAVCDSQGNSVISLLIERLPSVALKALDQFHLKDRINRKQFFYLNCLESHRAEDGPTRAKTPLEVSIYSNVYPSSAFSVHSHISASSLYAYYAIYQHLYRPCAVKQLDHVTLDL